MYWNEILRFDVLKQNIVNRLDGKKDHDALSGEKSTGTFDENVI